MTAADRVRLDKWLWAARFFKTRNLAKTAIDGGKVRLNGARTKPAKEVGIGDQLEVVRGEVRQTIIVTATAERRGNAASAATLYEETPDSAAQREAQRSERRLQRSGFTPPPRRPEKRQRRRLREAKTSMDSDNPR